MLRPRTVLRLVLYLLLSWLVLAVLYVGLPSFSRDDNGTDYATKVLKVDEYFPSSNNGGIADFTTNNERRRNLVLTFNVDKASDSLIICGTTKVSLKKPTQLTSVQKQGEENDDFVLLEPPIRVSAPAGDTDGISLPWFDTADAAIMFYLIHHDQALVKLRVGFREGGRKLEVWPGGDDWTHPLASQDDNPLLSLSLENERNTASRVSTANVPPSPLSFSPSPTYHIRLVLLIALAPLTIFIMGAYLGLSFVLSAVLAFLSRFFWIGVFSLLVCWLYKGRPPAETVMKSNHLRCMRP
ncbi:hypothetical protein BGW36DRAFT_421792 [Talaromyces proteolyticus]|uniref:Transmembrane protein n=1 Tax=Talaromyces proteolyticus TaxID=1131652 RepID=A0AAD4L540_9EURO|nr:uncharacterized protein BGW36DRAFT_421792 [Talaromyces proteolyticus]KAH8705226.1 hypothetical protein BGW36DRAFT_421792 [Talaromyces proteolyticus]